MDFTEKHSIRDNSPQRTERIKILFQYTVMLAGSVVMGMAVPSFLGDTALASIANTVTQHFDNPFSLCQTLSERIRLIAYYSLTDWILIAISFLFAFSILNYLISDVVLAYAGFRFGFSVSILYHMLRAPLQEFLIRVSHLVAFAVFKTLILICLFVYSCLLTVHSYRLKQSANHGRASIHMDLLLPLIACTLTASALIFLIHTAYGWIITII